MHIIFYILLWKFFQFLNKDFKFISTETDFQIIKKNPDIDISISNIRKRLNSLPFSINFLKISVSLSLKNCRKEIEIIKEPHKGIVYYQKLKLHFFHRFNSLSIRADMEPCKHLSIYFV